LKKTILQKRFLKKLWSTHSPEQERSIGNAHFIRQHLKNLPPVKGEPYVPKDDRMQREIADTLARILGGREENSFYTKLPRRDIGLG
jgi:hypothetical protein